MSEPTERRKADSRLDALVRDSSVFHSRLSNIEAAMQDMAKAMVTVARVEERLGAAQDRQQRIEDYLTAEIGALKDQIVTMTDHNEARATSSATTNERTRWIERILWVGLTLYFAYISGELPP